MKYKVGDRVRIKSNLHEGNDYDCYCNEKMVQYANTIQIIKEVYTKDYKLVGIEEWFFDDKMFEDTLFKVGNIVEITGNTNYSSLSIGDVGVIESINPEYNTGVVIVDGKRCGEGNSHTKFNEMRLISTNQINKTMKLKTGDMVTFKSGLKKGQVVNDIAITEQIAGWSKNNSTGKVGKVIDDTYFKFDGMSGIYSVGMLQEKEVVPTMLGYKAEKSGGKFKVGCKNLSDNFVPDVVMFLDTMKASGIDITSIKIAEGEITRKEIDELLKFMQK